MAKLSRKEREILYGKHSPAGYAHLRRKKQKTKPTYFKGKGFERPTAEERLKGKKIEYYGKKRETADTILRRIKKGK